MFRCCFSLVYFVELVIDVVGLCSSFLLQIFRLLILVLVFQEANMMPQHGQKLTFQRNTQTFLKQMNGFGLILHILFKVGARLHIKSEFIHISFLLCASICDNEQRPEKDLPGNAHYNYYVS
jgi:hypothetical protein